jgi:DNA mismatch repair protein MutS
MSDAKTPSQKDAPASTGAAKKGAKSAKSSDGLTPAMRQYVEQKATAPDALLLFRMGDFYELFYEDAKTAAKVLGIVLTTRGKDRSGSEIPLAGIPYHALESYLTKLVHAGHKVAISEQVEDPKQAKGVVKREIVRIVTPGTLTEDALLDDSADNYLACVCQQRGETGLAFVELSTGAFWVQRVDEPELVDELVRLGPAELLLPELPIDAADPLGERMKQLTATGQAMSGVPITRRSTRLFDPFQAERRLKEHFGVESLEGFGFDEMDASLCASGAIIEYLTETQKTSLAHIVSVRRRETQDYVRLDEATWRSLEIERTLRGGALTGSLLHAINRTSSSMGARCLRRWLAMPLRRVDAIKRRQEAVATLLCDVHALRDLRAELGRLSDIERITARLGVGRASPRDLVALGATLVTVEQIAIRLEGFASKVSLTPEGLPPFLADRKSALLGLTELADFLTTTLDPDAPLTINEGGIIAGGVDEELDRLRSVGTNGRQWLADFQNREIERSGIGSLKVGYNQVFGYYIEITNAHRDRVPAEYVRKQTLKNAERYITDELKQYETEVLTARDKANAREAELFEAVRQRTAEHIPQLQTLASAAAEIDVVAGLAKLADERRYVRPEWAEEPIIEITDGRHPVLEQMLSESFVPNDCRLGLAPESNEDAPVRLDRKPETLVILTGPNMAGKSTYIRQIALLMILAQTGGYVPATRMRLGVADRIFARVGASDEITRGQSTFMVEMTEAANILNNATDRSLVIVDELGRGTSTFDGLSLAWATAEQLAGKIGCRALFATHYHELTQLAEYLAGVANYQVAVREWEEDIVFLHRIVRGGTDRSYGAHVAKLAGMPPEVITRSKELLGELESNLSSLRRSPKRKRRQTRDPNQLELFTDPREEVMREMQQFDPDATAPIDALKKLAEWQKRLKNL